MIGSRVEITGFTVQRMVCSVVCVKCMTSVLLTMIHGNKAPCTRLRQQSVTAHEQSAAYKDYVKTEAATSMSENIASVVNPAVPARGIEHFCCCLYSMNKRNAHTLNYAPLLDLVGLLDVDVKANISVASNAIYTSDKTIQEKFFIMSEIMKKKNT